MSKKTVLISIPFQRSAANHAQEQYTALTRVPGIRDATPLPFSIPKLKVGTFDEMLEDSDVLARYDPAMESITSKHLNLLEDVFNQKQLAEEPPGPTSSRRDLAFLQVGQRGTERVHVQDYLYRFHWDEAQYPVSLPVKKLIDDLHGQCVKADEGTRLKMLEFNETKQRFTQAQRRLDGSLAVRPILEEIQKYYRESGREMPREDSSMLTTLFVVVSHDARKDFVAECMRLCVPYDSATAPAGAGLAAIAPAAAAAAAPAGAAAGDAAPAKRSLEGDPDQAGMLPLVVPNSIELVIPKPKKDQENLEVYAVTVLKPFVDLVRTYFRENKNKYQVRDPRGDVELTAGQLKDFKEELKAKREHLHKWLNSTFSECYIAWIHLKGIRLYVESIMRYGVPPAFVPIVVTVDSKKELVLRKELDKYTEALKRSAPPKSAADEEGASSALESYLYVSLIVASIHEPQR